ncbi:hypothetical protein F4808DRAFT_121991 [Astrocystis sublimbata]|nr:hypothetical protein F4808DRAFT_121991 [Astrocystis sublimbata]
MVLMPQSSESQGQGGRPTVHVQGQRTQPSSSSLPRRWTDRYGVSPHIVESASSVFFFCLLVFQVWLLYLGSQRVRDANMKELKIMIARIREEQRQQVIVLEASVPAGTCDSSEYAWRIGGAAGKVSSMIANPFLLLQPTAYSFMCYCSALSSL